MFKLECNVCKKEFSHIQAHTKICSDICRKERLLDLNGRRRYLEGIPTGTIGAISEMKVAIDLMEKGYSVFRALSPACFCDLIAVKGDCILKIEARTGYTATSGSGSNSYPKNTRGNIDIFAVYYGNGNHVVYYELDGKTIKIL